MVEEHKVEVWLADRVTGKVLLREVLMSKDTGQTQTDESTVVARAVELLRASLLELDIEERPRSDLGTPVNLPQRLQSPSALTVRTDRAARFGVTTGFGLLAATQHAAISAGLGVALRWHPTARLALLARTTVPFSGVSYSRPQGNGDVRPRWLSMGVRYSGPNWASKWEGAVESGFGLLIVDAVGIAHTRYLARSALHLDPVPYIGADLRYSLSPSMALSWGILGGPGLRPSKIVFDEQVIDRYGRWVMISQLGLDLTWH
jgi:hypothetical protein